MPEINRGDWVKHKCGGPKLFVQRREYSSLNTYLIYTVYWADDNFHWDQFEEWELEKIVEEPSSTIRS